MNLIVYFILLIPLQSQARAVTEIPPEYQSHLVFWIPFCLLNDLRVARSDRFVYTLKAALEVFFLDLRLCLLVNFVNRIVLTV